MGVRDAADFRGGRRLVKVRRAILRTVPRDLFGRYAGDVWLRGSRNLGRWEFSGSIGAGFAVRYPRQTCYGRAPEWRQGHRTNRAIATFLVLNWLRCAEAAEEAHND